MTTEEKKKAACVRSKAWRLANKERYAATKRAYYEKNKTEIYLYKAAWAEKNKERLKKKRASSYLNNRQKILDRAAVWKIENPERFKKNQADWRIRVGHRRAAQVAARRAITLKGTPKWANQFFIDEIYDLAQLRTRHLGIKHHVDHIVPLRHPLVCGLHVENNMRVIPGAENLKKGNRHWPDMPS